MLLHAAHIGLLACASAPPFTPPPALLKQIVVHTAALLPSVLIFRSQLPLLSLNWSVLLLLCSGVHRRLGVHVSKVRSTVLDTKVWEPAVVGLFQHLGNDFAKRVWEGGAAAEGAGTTTPGGSKVKTRDGAASSRVGRRVVWQACRHLVVRLTAAVWVPFSCLHPRAA